jgi:hypothetical protein
MNTVWSLINASIIETVKFHRPDLLFHLSSKGFPIFLNPVQSYFESMMKWSEECTGIITLILVSGVPGVGELMVASFPVSVKFHRTIRPDNPWCVLLSLSIFIFL